MKKDIGRLIEGLNAWSPLVASGYEVPAASKTMDEVAEYLKSIINLTEDYDYVEKIAKSMYEAHCTYHGFKPYWDDEPGLSKLSIRNQAKAAIRTIFGVEDGKQNK